MSYIPVAFAAGTQSAVNSTVVFSDSNGISFGLSGSSRITAALDGLRTISADGVNAVGSNIVFSNSNGVSFGANGATITASAVAGPTIDFYDNYLGQAYNDDQQNFILQNSQIRTLKVFPLNFQNGFFPGNMTVSTMMMECSVVTNANATLSGQSFSVKFGVYTQNGASLSLLNTGAMILSQTVNATDNSIYYVGKRWFTLHSSAWSSAPAFKYGSAYYVGYVMDTASVLGLSLSYLGLINYSTAIRSGSLGVSQTTSATVGNHPWLGNYTATTNALPTAIGISDLNRNNASCNFVPHIAFNNQIPY